MRCWLWIIHQIEYNSNCIRWEFYVMWILFHQKSNEYEITNSTENNQGWRTPRQDWESQNHDQQSHWRLVEERLARKVHTILTTPSLRMPISVYPCINPRSRLDTGNKGTQRIIPLERTTCWFEGDWEHILRRIRRILVAIERIPIDTVTFTGVSAYEEYWTATMNRNEKSYHLRFE